MLVGHSFGGLVVRLYASTYPDEVAGLVLVDAQPEAIQVRLTPARWAAYEALLLQPPPGFETVNSIETVDFDASFARMRAAAWPPPRPLLLAVLSKSRPFELPPDLPAGFSADALEQAWQAAQDGLVALVPNARHSIASGSGHDIHQD